MSEAARAGTVWFRGSSFSWLGVPGVGGAAATGRELDLGPLAGTGKCCPARGRRRPVSPRGPARLIGIKRTAGSGERGRRFQPGTCPGKARLTGATSKTLDGGSPSSRPSVTRRPSCSSTRFRPGAPGSRRHPEADPQKTEGATRRDEPALRRRRAVGHNGRAS